MLGYSIVASFAVRLNLGLESISHTTNMIQINFLYPTSYVYDPTNTKLKLREKSDFRL